MYFQYQTIDLFQFLMMKLVFFSKRCYRLYFVSYLTFDEIVKRKFTIKILETFPEGYYGIPDKVLIKMVVRFPLRLMAI